MNNYHEYQANAAECTRMADATIDPLDKALWTEMAEHWIYLSPPSPTSLACEFTASDERPQRAAVTVDI